MRIKSGSIRARRHRAVRKAARGYRLSIRARYKTAQEAVLHAGQYAYGGRRLRKRDVRKLWILRINAGLKTVDEKLSYSVFMNLLKKHDVVLNRKMLAELAVNDADTFKALATKVYGK